MWVSLLKLALIPYKKSEDEDGSMTTTEEAPPPPGKIGKQPSPSLRAQLFCGNFHFFVHNGTCTYFAILHCVRELFV